MIAFLRQLYIDWPRVSGTVNLIESGSFVPMTPLRVVIYAI
jgi:hypothetical protein